MYFASPSHFNNYDSNYYRKKEKEHRQIRFLFLKAQFIFVHFIKTFLSQIIRDYRHLEQLPVTTEFSIHEFYELV